MSIDWKKEAENRKDEMLADLKMMLEIESVRDESKGTPEAPLGPGPKEALDKFLEIGKRDGFETLELDGLAGHIEFGEGNETMAMLAHVDVMPAGKGWNTDPFKPVIKDGNLYARGAQDDKGPGMACYYGLKIIKELGLPVSKKVHFILNFEGSNGGDVELLSFESGLRENMVPRDCEVKLNAKNSEEIIEAFDAYVAGHPVVGTAFMENGTLFLHMIGKAAHAQEPRKGENAGTYMADFLQRFNFGGDAENFVKFTAEYLHKDSRMKNFGIDFTDDVMGDLTMNAGIFSFEAGKGGKITLNFRFPKGMDEKTIEAGLEKVVAPMNVSLEQGSVMVPHYVSPDDPLVSTLLDVYNRQMGTKETGKVVGGGTYGRLMERGVAFGAMFPDTPDTMHQANEYVPVDVLVNACAIYAEAIYELIK